MESRSTLIEVRRDVCVRAYECAGWVDRIELVPRAAVRASQITRTLDGLSLILEVKHGASLDWANYAHFTSAALLLTSAVHIELASRTRLAGRLHHAAGTGLRVLLPQVHAVPQRCGGRSASKVPALMARGYASEVFATMALAASGTILETIGNRSGRSTDAALAAARTELLTCHNVSSRPPAPRYTCFDTTLRPRRNTMLHTMRHTMVSVLPNLSTAAATSVGSALRRAAWSVLGARMPLPPKRRSVVLLTRRTQSRWINRQQAVEALRGIALAAGASFTDAGDAEDLGATPARCYRALPQLRLWARAWLVVSVVGAHESNVVFMRSSAAGLLESQNCGFVTGTYAFFARAAGVPYAVTREVKQSGHGWLREAATEVIRHTCDVLHMATQACSTAAILERHPTLYERKSCSHLSGRYTRPSYFNLPRQVLLTGPEADVPVATRALLH